jgi:hypothetical protein
VVMMWVAALALEVIGIYLPASGEVGQAIKLVIGGPANLTAHLTT